MSLMLGTEHKYCGVKMKVSAYHFLHSFWKIKDWLFHCPTTSTTFSSLYLHKIWFKFSNANKWTFVLYLEGGWLRKTSPAKTDLHALKIISKIARVMVRKQVARVSHFYPMWKKIYETVHQWLVWLPSQLLLKLILHEFLLKSNKGTVLTFSTVVT